MVKKIFSSEEFFLVPYCLVSFAAVVWARHATFPLGRERCVTSSNNGCKGDYILPRLIKIKSLLAISMLVSSSRVRGFLRFICSGSCFTYNESKCLFLFSLSSDVVQFETFAPVCSQDK